MIWLKNLWQKLFGKKTPVQPKPESPKAMELIWMGIAKRELGQKEVSGDTDNPRILEYGKSTTYFFKHDEVPWCSAFVNWVFMQAGIKRTKSAAAASWLMWGVELKTPKYGCVVVKRRPGGNHVTFYIRPENKDGVEGFIGLGGNQGNRVCEAWYANDTIRAYRWPEDKK